jgi:hypothetical protein
VGGRGVGVGEGCFLGNAHPGERGAGGCGKRWNAGVYCVAIARFPSPPRGVLAVATHHQRVGPRAPVNVAMTDRGCMGWLTGRDFGAEGAGCLTM